MILDVGVFEKKAEQMGRYYVVPGGMCELASTTDR